MRGSDLVWVLVAILGVLLMFASVIIYGQWQSSKFRKENDVKSKHSIKASKRRRNHRDS